MNARLWQRRPLWLMAALLAGAGLLLSTTNATKAARLMEEEMASPASLAASSPASAPSAYVYPAVGPVALYTPAGPPRGVVIALSGAQGWDAAQQALGQRLAAGGALVAGLSTPAFLHALNRTGRCINPNYALLDFARDLQHRLAMPLYDKPILVGRGAGAALAYAALASGPDGSYKALLTQDFTPLLAGAGRWCRAARLKVAPISHPARGWAFAASPHLPSPWTVMDDPAHGAALRRFLTRTDARLVGLPAGQREGRADAALLAQIRPLLAPPVAAAALPSGLPLNIVTDPAAPRTAMMAVLYSGDGGWVGLDKDVAAQLAHAGIPVVGIDSLSYFWSQRTPEGAAADLGAVIRGYSQRWQRPRLLLVGYSFGADVLPYIVGRLAPPLRQRIERLSLLGLSPSADFQFHLSSWLDLDASRQYPTVPAIERLRGVPMLCIRGDRESDSACPAIPRDVAQSVVVPGGHHFDRNAPLLVNRMLTGLMI